MSIFHDFNNPIYTFTLADFNYPENVGNAISHYHRHYELCVIISGDVRLGNGSKSYSTDKPCIVFHPPYTFHITEARSGVLYNPYVFHFLPEVFARIQKDNFDPSPLFLQGMGILPIGDALLAELIPILELYNTKPRFEYHQPIDPMQEKLILMLILEASMRFIGDMIYLSNPHEPLGDGSPVCDGYIGEVVDYIREHLSEKLTAEKLAERFYVSPQKLHSDFKEMMGNTIRQHIIDTRITTAMRMLSEGHKNSDVAYMCGFASESSFIHTFSERVGISPSKFAKNSFSRKS